MKRIRNYELIDVMNSLVGLLKAYQNKYRQIFLNNTIKDVCGKIHCRKILQL